MFFTKSFISFQMQRSREKQCDCYIKHCYEFLDNFAKPPMPFTKQSWHYISIVYALIQLFKGHRSRNNFKDIASRNAKIDN